MTPQTLTIPYGDGVVAVRDYGGAGPPVLFVHTLGFNAVNWERVAPVMTDTNRVLALDLPGHGRSTATMARPEDVFESQLAVVRELGLEPTLLVGHDTGSLCVLEAVTSAPELFSAGVAIGGTVVRTREEMQELCDFAASDYFVAAMRERFEFGTTGRGRAAANEVIETMVANAAVDWIMKDIENLRDEREYALRWGPDDSWRHLPEPQDVAIVGRFDPGSPLYPTQDRLPDLQRPVWILQLSDGQDVQFAERERELAVDHDMLRLIPLESGQWPQYTMPQELADVLSFIAADPTGQPR